MRNKHGRKTLNFSVKRQMQLRLLIKVLGIVFVGIGIMAAVFYFYSNREITGSYKQFHVTAKNFLDYLWPAIISSFIIATIVAVAITLFLPNKIAGPLYRIENDLKDKVSKGDLTVKLILRKGDEVTDLADVVNMTIGKLRQKIEKISKPAIELDARIKSMDGKADKEIENLSAKINEALQEFKIK